MPTLQEIINAYEQVRPKEPGILQNAFDALMPHPAQGPPTPALMTSSLGPVGPFGLPIRERLASLMENPNYLETPLKYRLNMLKGQPMPRSNEFSNLLKQAQDFRTTTSHMSEIVDRKVPAEQLIPEGWVRQLIEGGKR